MSLCYSSFTMLRVATASACLLFWVSLCVGQNLPRPENNATHVQMKTSKDAEISKREDAQPQPNFSHPAAGSQPCKDNGDGKKSDSQGEPQGWFEAYVLLTGLMALCSLVAALATRRSANAAVKAANTSEMALKLSERADILLEGASVLAGVTQKVDQDSQVVMGFRNFGRTRAQNVRFEISLEIPGVPNSIPPQAPITIGAGETQSLCFPRFAEFLTRETGEGIARGKIPLKFRGSVTYDDVFEDPHTFRCGGTFDHRTGTFRMDEHRELESRNPN